MSPSLEKKAKVLHLMESLGIHSADIGLPAAGPHVEEQVLHLAREIVDNRMKIRPNCAARTVISDIEPIARVADKVGIPIEVAMFIGSSPIRQYAEDWNLDLLLRHTEKAVSWAVAHGVPPMYVTEDTTRARPESIRRLYTAAIEAGARRVVVCDTVGHATPDGVTRLLRFVRGVIDDTGEDVQLDWHGHRDRGLSVPNSLTAIEAGADCVHGTAIGIGERCGNAPMDQLLVNLRLLGWIDNDLTHLADYCQTVAEATSTRIPARLSGGWEGRLSDGDRRARRGHHQGDGQGRRMAGGPRLFGRPGRGLRPPPTSRGRPHERPFERHLLAAKAWTRADRRVEAPDLSRGQGRATAADR